MYFRYVFDYKLFIYFNTWLDGVKIMFTFLVVNNIVICVNKFKCIFANIKNNICFLFSTVLIKWKQTGLQQSVKPLYSYILKWALIRHCAAYYFINIPSGRFYNFFFLSDSSCTIIEFTVACSEHILKFFFLLSE